jgi:hypothetical protein
MVAPTCFGITLPSSGRVPSAFCGCSIDEQSIEYFGWACSGVVRGDLRDRHALGKLPKDGNEMPKHVGDTIHN